MRTVMVENKDISLKTHVKILKSSDETPSSFFAVIKFYKRIFSRFFRSATRRRIYIRRVGVNDKRCKNTKSQCEVDF